jgi:DNA (cytosine-5)-methyltransferase 1
MGVDIMTIKYFSMFSGVGGFENGIHRAVKRIKTSRQTDTPSNSTMPESGNEERGLRTSCIGKGGEYVIQNIQRRGQQDALTIGNLPMPGSGDEWGRWDKQQAVCIGYSEIDKYAIQIYQRHFPEHKNYGDATKIDERQLPDFDLLVGGFPCQSFSVAGKRLGFNETRGTLFFDIARILSHKRPRNFLLENVKGLLSHDNGKTFQTIIGVLTDIGYCVEWQVLNSKDFGVPQNRERVFIVGHLGGLGGRKVFPVELCYGENHSSDGQTQSKIIDPKYLMRDCKIYNEQCPTMTKRDYKEPFIVAQAIPVLTPDRPEKRQNGRRMKEDGDPAFTLTAQDRHGIFDGYRIRRLTPVECARLQGFPDDWHEGVSDSQAYRCYGNAVTVNVIEAIMMKFLLNEYQDGCRWYGEGEDELS